MRVLGHRRGWQICFPAAPTPRTTGKSPGHQRSEWDLGAFAACRQSNTLSSTAAVREQCQGERGSSCWASPCWGGPLWVWNDANPWSGGGYRIRTQVSWLPAWTRRPTGSFSVVQEPWQERSEGTWSPDRGKKEEKALIGGVICGWRDPRDGSEEAGRPLLSASRMLEGSAQDDPQEFILGMVQAHHTSPSKEQEGPLHST